MFQGIKSKCLVIIAKRQSFDFAGLVLDYNPETKSLPLQQRNHFKPGQEVEFFGPEIENFTHVIDKIWDEDDTELDAARHPLQIVKFKVAKPVFPNNMMQKRTLKVHSSCLMTKRQNDILTNCII